MFVGPPAVAEYFHANRIDWPVVVVVVVAFVAYAVVVVVVVALDADAALVASVHFDIDQLDTYDTDWSIAISEERANSSV